MSGADLRGPEFTLGDNASGIKKQRINLSKLLTAEGDDGDDMMQLGDSSNTRSDLKRPRSRVASCCLLSSIALERAFICFSQSSAVSLSVSALHRHTASPSGRRSKRTEVVVVVVVVVVGRARALCGEGAPSAAVANSRTIQQLFSSQQAANATEKQLRAAAFALRRERGCISTDQRHQAFKFQTMH